MNFRALGLHLGTPAMIVAAIVAAASFGVILSRRSLVESAAAALLMSLLCSPHTYVQDYAVLPVVAVAGLPVALQCAVVLPWLYFLPVMGRDVLSPLIPLNLACLIGMAIPAEPILRRVRRWRPKAVSGDSQSSIGLVPAPAIRLEEPRAEPGEPIPPGGISG